MGVSLERVQFKFASIIGELCSEPVILSQFAVWVDLKMAEYKAKGAMSLDCSGCKPKPTWMKGVIPPEKASIQEEDRLTDRRTGIGVSDESTGPSFSDYSERPPIHDRLSPELIIVKEEPRSPHETFHKDYYSDSTLKPSTSVSRKRYSEEAGVEYHSSVKVKRTSFLPHNQSEQNSEANQSLLSVIGGGENANEEKVSLIDRSLPLTQSAGTFPSTSQHSQSMYNLADIKLGQEDSSNNGAWSHDVFANYPWMFQERAISTSKKTITDVNTFRRWLKPLGEHREITEIPPVELDAYLQQFYVTVKKRDGSLYTASSLRYVYASLGRYLKDKCYPANLASSVLFAPSRAVLDKRRRELQELASVERSPTAQESASNDLNASLQSAVFPGPKPEPDGDTF